MEIVKTDTGSNCVPIHSVIPHPPPNSSAPGNSTTTTQPVRDHPKPPHPDEPLALDQIKLIRPYGRSPQVDHLRLDKTPQLIFNQNFAEVIGAPHHPAVGSDKPTESFNAQPQPLQTQPLLLYYPPFRPESSEHKTHDSEDSR